MKHEVFLEGVALLRVNFRNLELSDARLATWKLLLDDMGEDDYRRGVLVFCRTIRELYPNTNVVACIRDCGKPPRLSPEEGWEYVVRGLRAGLGYSAGPGWREECESTLEFHRAILAGMPPDVREITDRMGWGRLYEAWNKGDTNLLENTYRKTFLANLVSARQRNREQLPGESEAPPRLDGVDLSRMLKDGKPPEARNE